MVPVSGEIRSALELEPCTDADRPKGTKVDDCSPSSSKKARSSMSEEDFLPNLKPKKGTELRFTPFPEKTYPEGSTPAEITHHSLDSSYLFEQVQSNYNE